ncbi:unnamed protein product, partial [Laminaria digitata]
MVSRTGRLRIHHLRADTGGEYISKELIKLCGNSGITMGYTPRWHGPHPNGESERDGQTLSTIYSQVSTVLKG